MMKKDIQQLHFQQIVDRGVKQSVPLPHDKAPLLVCLSMCQRNVTIARAVEAGVAL